MTEGFIGDFDLHYIDGRNWRLKDPDNDWGYVTQDGASITPGDGFVTDFASVPWFFRRLFPPAGDGPNRAYGPAAVIHDQLYQSGNILGVPVNREWADSIFLRAMLRLDVERWVAYTLWLGVRLGGWLPWSRYRKTEGET